MWPKKALIPQSRKRKTFGKSSSWVQWESPWARRNN